MQVKMNARLAEAVLREEASKVGDGPISDEWENKVEHLSKLCEDGISKTHIAFLGTAMLAQSMGVNADLRAIKPRLSPDNPNAYSARSLCHSVVVPLSAELGFSLGVSGREPLNNQPYFRMTTLGDNTPVHSGGRVAFDFMIRLVDELQHLSVADARRAIRAFIAVRRSYQRRYADPAEGLNVSPAELLSAVQKFVSYASEGGRRAQAIVAGLLDIVAGTGRILSGRINDPSRHHPGDVAVLTVDSSDTGAKTYEKAFEVRDKPARFSDVTIFGRTCVDRGVQEAAMVLVSLGQPSFDPVEVLQWAQSLGLSMTIFSGWTDFVEQCLFWAAPSKAEGAMLAVETIRNRLIEVEVSTEALSMWDELTH